MTPATGLQLLTGWEAQTGSLAPGFSTLNPVDIWGANQWMGLSPVCSQAI